MDWEAPPLVELRYASLGAREEECALLPRDDPEPPPLPPLATRCGACCADALSPDGTRDDCRSPLGPRDAPADPR